MHKCPFFLHIQLEYYISLHVAFFPLNTVSILVVFPHLYMQFCLNITLLTTQYYFLWIYMFIYQSLSNGKAFNITNNNKILYYYKYYYNDYSCLLHILVVPNDCTNSPFIEKCIKNFLKMYKNVHFYVSLPFSVLIKFC